MHCAQAVNDGRQVATELLRARMGAASASAGPAESDVYREMGCTALERAAANWRQRKPFTQGSVCGSRGSYQTTIQANTTWRTRAVLLSRGRNSSIEQRPQCKAISSTIWRMLHTLLPTSPWGTDMGNTRVPVQHGDPQHGIAVLHV